MSTTRAIPAILGNNALRMLRDQFLLGMSAYVMGCAVALRWLVPWLQSELLRENQFDIGPYIALGVSYFVVINASVVTGLLGGFLLLENREERTLQALMVTPTPLSVHLGSLGAAILVSGFGVTVVLSALVGVGVPDWGAVLVSAAVGAPYGVVMALILATVASNKVEAFAVLKLTSILGLVPVAGFFLPQPLQLLVGLTPPYWGCKIWWMAAAGESGWAWYVLPGLLVSALWIALLIPRFHAAARR